MLVSNRLSLTFIQVPSSLAFILLMGVQPGLAAGHETSEDLLGRGHLWVEVNQTNFSSEIDDIWGVDTETYVGLGGYWGGHRNIYVGVEVGRIGVGSAVSTDGDRIEDFDFITAEINVKRLFDLSNGLSFGVGSGIGGFWADGEEVQTSGRSELADVGYGYQVFVEFNWRVSRFVTGIDIKYQAAIDFLEIDYSNLRIGGHVGIVF